jgi:hypothetical protein
VIYGDLIAVEFAVLDALAADQQLKAWGIEPESLPGLSKHDELARLFRRHPAAGLYTPRGTFERSQDGNIQYECGRILILAAGANYRSPSAPRAGGPKLPGANHIISRFAQIITATWPEPTGNIAEIKPKNWSLVWCNRQIAVCVLEIETKLARPLPPSPQEIKAYGTSY